MLCLIGLIEPESDTALRSTGYLHRLYKARTMVNRNKEVKFFSVFFLPKYFFLYADDTQKFLSKGDNEIKRQIIIGAALREDFILKKKLVTASYTNPLEV